MGGYWDSGTRGTWENVHPTFNPFELRFWANLLNLSSESDAPFAIEIPTGVWDEWRYMLQMPL